MHRRALKRKLDLGGTPMTESNTARPAENCSANGQRGPSRADAECLATLEKKLELVRDNVRAVAGGYVTGLILWGRGGMSKTFTVLDELRQLQIPHRLSNSRVSGWALFNTLANYPDRVHVLDDVEPLMRDGNALGVLRSALWAQPADGGGCARERWIT
jgi:hypothetical protein